MIKKVKIKAFKHPDIPHYEWDGELLKETEDYIMVLCKPGRKLKHHTKNDTFILSNTSIEIFFKKEWFTVSASIDKGQVKSYYCNIAKPSTFQGGVVSFVDLDLDYVNKIGIWEWVDEDEFIENSKNYHYSQELMNKTRKASNILEEKVKNKTFPFDDTFENELKNIS